MTNTQVNVERRSRRLIVNPRFQFSLMRLAVGIWMVNAAFVMGFIYYLYGGPVGFELVLGQAPMPILPSPPPQLLFLAGLVAAVCLLLAVAAVLVVSHRIAGPAYRLKRSMERVTAGDVDFVVTLRRGDCFNDLGDRFNEMLDSLGSQLQRDIATLRSVEEVLPESSAQRSELRALREGKELQVWGAVQGKRVGRFEPAFGSAPELVTSAPMLVSDRSAD